MPYAIFSHETGNRSIVCIGIYVDSKHIDFLNLMYYVFALTYRNNSQKQNYTHGIKSVEYLRFWISTSSHEVHDVEIYDPLQILNVELLLCHHQTTKDDNVILL